MKGPALPALVALATLVSATAVLAEDRVVREYSFDVTDIEEIDIHASVGSIDIVADDGDEIMLVLEIEGQDSGWFRRGKDVSGVELESRVRGDRLELRQTEDDTNTNWTIRMPVVASTRIHMGVGDIDAEFGATELDVELGVGDVDIEYPKEAAGHIDLDVGVGDASLRGTRDVETHKAFISHAVNGNGDGENDIRVHVGVGDVDLSLF